MKPWLLQKQKKGQYLLLRRKRKARRMKRKRQKRMYRSPGLLRKPKKRSDRECAHFQNPPDPHPAVRRLPLTSSLTEAGCPGHVDLTLSVTILGTEGEGNLFKALLLEAEGGTEGGQGSEWTWDEEKIGAGAGYSGPATGMRSMA